MTAAAANADVRSIIRSLEEETHTQSTLPLIVREHPSREDARVAFYETTVRDVSQLYGGKPVLRYIGSDNSEDRHVSILEQGKKAVRTDAYVANPVFVWAHQYGIPVIGNTLGLDLQKERTIFDVEFLLDAWDLPNTANLARLVYRLAKDNNMRGSSVGFIPIKQETYEPKDTTVELPWFMTPTRFLEWELLELSSVPIPSNRSALKKAFDGGALTENEIDVLGIGKFMRDPLIVLNSLPRAIVKAPAPPPPVVTPQCYCDKEKPVPHAAHVLRGPALSAEELRDVDSKEVLLLLQSCGDVTRARDFLKEYKTMTPEQRKGAVLNRRNASRLMDATDQINGATELIGQVLDEAGYGGGDAADASGDATPKDADVRAHLTSLASDVQTLSQQLGTSPQRTDDDGATAAGESGAGAGGGQGDADVLTQLSSMKDLAGTILNFQSDRR